MNALVLTASAGALVVALAWRARPLPRRVAALHRSGPSRGRVVGPTVRRAVPWLGRVLAVLAGMALWPPSVVVMAAWWLAAPHLRSARQRRRAEARVVRCLPDAIDLLVLTVGAGQTLPLAVSTLARSAPDPFGRAFAEVDRRRLRGLRLAEALKALPELLGRPVQPLTAALVATDRYGVALSATLEQLAIEARRERRRSVETAARKLPIRLSFPLVCCILPAFALLTVAPLLAGALGSLRL